MLFSFFPVNTAASTPIPQSIDAPQNITVTASSDSEGHIWNYTISLTAPPNVAMFAGDSKDQWYAGDLMGNLSVCAEFDYKYNDNKWHYNAAWDREDPAPDPFNYGYLSDLSENSPGLTMYINPEYLSPPINYISHFNHYTIYFRVRFVITYNNAEGNPIKLISGWSETAAFGSNANQQAAAPEAPTQSAFGSIKSPVKPLETITVEYFNAPNQINAWIGIFPQGDTTNNTMTWKSLQGQANGNYTATAPSDPGKYYYRIYNADNEIIAESSIFEVKPEVLEGIISSGEPFTGTVVLPVYQLGSDILTATPGDSFITLKWNEATDKNGLDGYYLYKGTGPGGESSSPMFDFPITELTYKDTLVTKDVTYYYIMKPVYGGGTRLGAASNEVSAKASFQSSQGVIVLTIGESTMLVNGISQTIDAPPVIVSGRTFVPVRVVAQALGGDVAWNPSEKKVTITLNSKTIELWIGNTTAKVNGEAKTLDVPPYISNGRTMLPLRFIIENLGCEVVWNGPAQTITIYYDGTGSHTGTTEATDPTGQPSDPSDAGDTPSWLSDLSPVEISSVSGGVIHTGIINPSGENWTANNGPHIVEGEFRIEGANAPVLVIEAGTKVLFKEDAYIYVGYGSAGGIMVNGTPDAPVVFAANSNVLTPGFWQGIRFYNLSSKDKCYIHNAIIQNAGDASSADQGAITLGEDTTGIELKNVKILNSMYYGLQLHGGARLGTNSTNLSILQTLPNSGNGGYPISTYLHGSNGLPKGGSFFGNYRNAVEIIGYYSAVINEDFIWKNLGIPYAVKTNLEVGGSNNPVFTIEPGVIVLFDTDKYLRVGYNGTGEIIANAKASGDQSGNIEKAALEASLQLASSDAMLDSSKNLLKENKIIIFGSLGSSTAKGVWAGIELLEGAISGNIFNGCIISGAGANGKGALSAASMVENQLKLANTLINGSSASGLELLGNIELLPGSVGNIFKNNNIPVSLSPFAAGSLLPGNEILSNANNYIQIINDTLFVDSPISKSAIWSNLGVPYLIKNPFNIQGAEQEAILTLSEGLELIFEQNSGINIGLEGTGSLIALGTPGNPVTFTSVLKSAGSWNGLHFFENTGLNSKLENIVLEYAATGLTFDAFPGSDILKNSTIQFCQLFGVDRNFAEDLVDILLDFLIPGLGNTFLGNGADQK